MFKCKTFYNSEKRIWYGPKCDLIVNQSIGSVILESLKLNSDKVAQICDSSGARTTFHEIYGQTIKILQKLHQMELNANDVIGLVASNSEYLAPLVFAALLLGLPINCLDPSFNEHEIEHMYRITKPKVVFCDGLVFNTTKKALESINMENCPIFTLNNHIPNVNSIEEFFTEENPPFNYADVKLSGDHTAIIICSSGTTGLPKGVCLSQKMLLKLTDTEIKSTDTLLTFSTLYWISGIFILLTGTRQGATRIITTNQFSPELLLRFIEEYRVSFILGPPSQVARAIQCPDIKWRNLSSVKIYMAGGSILPQTIANEMQRYLCNGKIYSGYGMSEIGAFASCGLPIDIQGNVGQILPNIQIKIIDEDQIQLGVNDIGEVLIKMPFKLPGYYGNPEATQDIYDTNGWIHSGDLGSFNSDGDLIIYERKKDILKYCNFHYYPTEIEQVIMELPGVLEVCVCGLPDVIATDLPAAAIVRNLNYHLTEKMVYDYVAEKMVNFKHLRGGVYFIKQIPKTASGKVLRRNVKTLLESLKTNVENE